MNVQRVVPQLILVAIVLLASDAQFVVALRLLTVFDEPPVFIILLSLALIVSVVEILAFPVAE